MFPQQQFQAIQQRFWTARAPILQHTVDCEIRDRRFFTGESYARAE